MREALGTVPVGSRARCNFLMGSDSRLLVVIRFVYQFLKVLTERKEAGLAREASGTVPAGSQAQCNLLMGSDS